MEYARECGCPSQRATVPAPGTAPPLPPRLVSRLGERCMCVCAQRREAPGAPACWVAGIAASVATGFERGRSPIPSADGRLGSGDWGGARAGCEIPQLPGTGVGPATPGVCSACECAGACAPCARGGRASERTSGRALAANVRCGETLRPGAALQRCRGAEVWVRWRMPARLLAVPVAPGPGRPIEK